MDFATLILAARRQPGFNATGEIHDSTQPVGEHAQHGAYAGNQENRRHCKLNGVSDGSGCQILMEHGNHRFKKTTLTL
jgi:hypothetical protein